MRLVGGWRHDKLCVLLRGLRGDVSCKGRHKGPESGHS